MPEQLVLYLAALTLAVLVAGAATAIVLRLLRARAILDRPNERSSHAEPVPRGGGIAVVAVVAAGWLVALALYDAAPLPAAVALAAMLGLAAVSWADDLRTLAAAPRLAAQAVAVAAALAVWPADVPVLGGLVPPWADRLVAGLAWLWFVNLFNFMDGMDGMAGTEAAAIGIGLAGLALAAGLAADVGMLGAVAAGAALGFLWFNRPPARIFLGDVGSVPLGFALGWLLLRTAAEGLWAPALILPLYFLADATITLLRRAARGERVWRAHREHYYQQALARGWSHRRVLLPVAAANCVLVALAWLGAERPWPALAAAALVVALLLAMLAGRRGVRAGAPE